MGMAARNRFETSLERTVHRVFLHLFRQHPIEKGGPTLGQFRDVYRICAHTQPYKVAKLEQPKEPTVVRHDAVEIISMNDHQSGVQRQASPEFDFTGIRHSKILIVIAIYPDDTALKGLCRQEIKHILILWIAPLVGIVHDIAIEDECRPIIERFDELHESRFSKKGQANMQVTDDYGLHGFT